MLNKTQPGGIWKWTFLIFVVVLIGIVSIAAINRMKASLDQNEKQIQVEEPLLKLPSPIFPPILWILTARDINNSRLNPTFFGHHLQYVANKSGFEPRFVDHESAYAWLSDPVKDIITKAMHRRRYELSVEDFLRLALIIENGGATVVVGDTIFIEELDWIKNIFQDPKSNKSKDILQCSLNSSPELFMFNSKGFYSDLFIAAQKNSSLLWTIFLQMAEAVQKGTPSLKSIQSVHMDTKAIFINKPFQFLLNAYLSHGNQSACQKWGLQSVEADSSINKIYKCSKGLTQFLNERIDCQQ